MKDTEMELWLKVTADEYELPMAVADSCPELAAILGIDRSTIFRSAQKYEKQGRGGKRRYIYRRVRVEGDIEDWLKEEDDVLEKKHIEKNHEGQL